jgi:CDP-2,3-bis-(O-geranylgeranyl)-sn-glycerol synthase
LFGFGAIAGDAIESFFKRQRNVAPGHSWFPFDQIDYVIGTIIAVSPFVQLHFWQYVVLLVFGMLGSLVSSYIGYLTGFKERPI